MNWISAIDQEGVLAIAPADCRSVAEDSAVDRMTRHTRRKALWCSVFYVSVPSAPQVEGEPKVPPLGRGMEAASNRARFPPKQCGRVDRWLRPRVAALDLIPAMLAVASERPPVEGASIEWIEGTAQALPCADASFDVVCCQLGASVLR
jgi:SAM-dependent methyltransferase